MTQPETSSLALVSMLGAEAVVDASRVAYFDDALTRLGSVLRPGAVDREPRAESLATALERLYLDTNDDHERQQLADRAYLCRRGIDPRSFDNPSASEHRFFLAVDGVVAERHPEVSLLLRELPDLDFPKTLTWDVELRQRISRAFVFLCRKGGGWSDIEAAQIEIHRLRELQEEREPSHFAAVGVNQEAVAEILVLFNLAKIVETCAMFISSGTPSDPLLDIDRHYGHASALLERIRDPGLLHFADALHHGTRNLVQSSVWFNTRQLGEKVREFIDAIADSERDDPILELWPSQRRAINSELLNPARRAVVVEMPTSAGKTLLAEFSIVQALALNPNSRVAYVVPTRALVNQVTARLRRDFEPLGYATEAAVPVFELDPAEDELLSGTFHIIVTTPEKLDLLLRVGHSSVQELSLVVADEAHNISDGTRGARLELLLGLLRREHPTARFLLLTPFVPNGDELASWLGGDPNGLIQLTWRPSERISAAALRRKVRGGPHQIWLRTMPGAGQVDVEHEKEILLTEVSKLVKSPSSKKAISASAAIQLARQGGVLILLRGRATAEERAGEIAKLIEPSTPSPLAQAVMHFAAEELGSAHPLPDLIERGIAFHHAGLSHDLRVLIEALIESGDIRIVCGTTTLAQGVNFPIASVIVESLQTYVGPPVQWEQLSYAKFWNIAGRAGRALKDRLGLVVFPSRGPGDLAEVRDFLSGEAESISSALMEAIARLADAQEKFDLSFVSRHPTISVFLQYLTHCLRVAGDDVASNEVEDILRSSFGYSQARSTSPQLAEKLVRLARRYLETLQGRERGYLALADGTGFSLSSIDMLYAIQTRDHPEFRDPSFWSKDTLFSSDLSHLTSVVSVLGDVPELQLGSQDTGPFNPRRVAGIVQDWVNGYSISLIAERWFQHEPDPKLRVRKTSHYLHSKLVSQLPWGIGAIQRLAGIQQEQGGAASVPSFVFFGVSSREAAQLRMVGVPRIAADGLAALQRDEQRAFATFEELRGWVASIPASQWQRHLGDASVLTGDDCQRSWEVLAGVS